MDFETELSPVRPRRLPIKPVKASLGEPRECAKCGAENSIAAVDCKQCGIVFEKYQPLEEAQVASEIEMTRRHQLLAVWKDVAADYGNWQNHEKFVMACFEANALAFAGYKYGEILKAAPHQETALEMKERILALASQKFVFASDELRRFSGFGALAIRLPLLNQMVLVLGSMTITVGLVMPHAQPMIVAGAGAVGLAFFLRLFV